MKARVAIVVAAIVVVTGAAIAVSRANGTPAPLTLPFPPAADVSVAVAPTLTSTLANSPAFRLAGSVRGADGAAIAGALACDHPAFAAAVTCARTGEDGSFGLRVVAGLHKLEVLPPADSRWLPIWYPNGDTSRLGGFLDLRKADRTDVAVTLGAGQRVSGRVVDLSGKPVADAQACADPTGSDAEWPCTRTDADGRYTLVVAAAEYLFFYVPPGGSRLIPRWWRGTNDVLSADAMTVRSDVGGVDITLPPGYLVFGTVRSTSGKPVEHALVCVDTPFPTAKICRPTDKDGNYSVSVRPGRFLIQFRPSAGEGLVAQWYGGTDDPSTARQVFVSNDVRVDGALRSGKLVWGSVRGADGLPIEGAYVNAYDLSGAFVAGGRAGATGDYAFVLPTGQYRLQTYTPIGADYVSGAYGGGAGRTVTVVEKDTDVLADFVLGVPDLSAAR